MIHTELVNGAEVIAKLDGLPGRIREELKIGIGRAAVQLQRAVQQKLNGDVLKVRTGRLRRSIGQVVEEDGDQVAGIVSTPVASGPTSGQYAVANGVYTFASADAGGTAFISFQYTATSTVAKTSTVMNVPMGYAPQFRLDLLNAFGGKSLTLTLFGCVASKLSIATKLDDFIMPDFEFSAFADSAGRVMQWGTSE